MLSRRLTGTWGSDEYIYILMYFAINGQKKAIKIIGYKYTRRIPKCEIYFWGSDDTSGREQGGYFDLRIFS